MPARSARPSGRTTPKGTKAAPVRTPASRREQAVVARRSVERTFGGVRSGGRPVTAFRRSGHR